MIPTDIRYEGLNLIFINIYNESVRVEQCIASG